jgi:hypothetical protein
MEPAKVREQTMCVELKRYRQKQAKVVLKLIWRSAIASCWIFLLFGPVNPELEGGEGGRSSKISVEFRLVLLTHWFCSGPARIILREDLKLDFS